MTTQPRVLIVDDELPIRQMAARFFGAEGFRCDAAADGVEAQQALADETYDVVLLDMCMPDVNGHKLATGLLQQERHPVIIVATGIHEMRLARDLYSRGVDDVAHKPCDYRLLAVKAKALVARRQASANSESTVKFPVASRAASNDFFDFASAISEFATSLAHRYADGDLHLVQKQHHQSVV